MCKKCNKQLALLLYFYLPINYHYYYLWLRILILPAQKNYHLLARYIAFELHKTCLRSFHFFTFIIVIILHFLFFITVYILSFCIETKVIVRLYKKFKEYVF